MADDLLHLLLALAAFAVPLLFAWIAVNRGALRHRWKRQRRARR